MNLSTTIAGLIFILALATTSGGMAQSYVGGSGMVNAGYMWTPDLSSSLRSYASNSADFHKGYSIIGMELNYRNGSSVVVLSGYIGTQEAEQNNGTFIEPFVWKAHGGVGWMIFKTNSVFIYPVVGAGIFESSLVYHGNADFDIRTATRSTSLDISLHTDFFLNQPSTGETFTSVAIIGVRLGYTKGISVHELQGFSMTVSFGGIAFMKHKKSD